MVKRTRNSDGTFTVTLTLRWHLDKWDTIHRMAALNQLTVSKMVDTILDDWAALANRDLGYANVPRVLEAPPNERLAYKQRNGGAQ